MISSAPPKQCPRCSGLMIIEDDWYGKFASCIACGHVHETEVADPQELLEEEQATVRAAIRGGEGFQTLWERRRDRG